MSWERFQIPDGLPGTEQTVRNMRRLIEGARHDPYFVHGIRGIVKPVTERDYLGEVQAIKKFVQSNIRYLHDPIETETLASPQFMLADIQKTGKTSGDCDEFTTFELAANETLGRPTRIVVVSTKPDGDMSHVYGEILVNGRWVPSDSIMKSKPLGWAVKKGVTNKKIYEFHNGQMVEAMNGLRGLRGFGQESPSIATDAFWWMKPAETKPYQSDTVTYWSRLRDLQTIRDAGAISPDEYQRRVVQLNLQFQSVLQQSSTATTPGTPPIQPSTSFFGLDWLLRLARATTSRPSDVVTGTVIVPGVRLEPMPLPIDRPPLPPPKPPAAINLPVLGAAAVIGFLLFRRVG